MNFTEQINRKDPAFINPDYTEKLNSWNGRKVVHLPVTKENRSQWESFGITWIEPAFGNSFLANAVLPEGWQLKYNYTAHSFTLLDEKLLPKAQITSAVDKIYAHFFTEKESQFQFLAAKLKGLEKQDIAKNRSDTWSESYPFGVIKPHFPRKAEYQSGLHRVSPDENFGDTTCCFGFFATKELADEAAKFVIDFIEPLSFARLLNAESFEKLKTDGYIMTNPFVL